MQSLEVISVNLWQIIASLLNLLILFYLFKKFLFKPVNNMLLKRQSEIDERYEAAESAKRNAEVQSILWDEKMVGAKEEADSIVKKARDNAERQGEKIISEAKEQAEGIIRRAESQAQLEMQKAEDEIKKEIVEVSTALANKLLEREISAEDHKKLINSFIEKIGDDDE